MEQWRDLKDYEEFYEVSNKGRIRNKKKGKLLNPYTDSRGYLSVDLCYGVRRKARMHKLVLHTFNPGGYFDGADIDHKDGDKQNNELSNLEYVTHAENIMRHYRNKAEPMIGVSPTGEKYEFLVISEFARENDLEFRHVSSCLQGKIAQHKGWVFYYKSEGKPRKVSEKKNTKIKECIGISPEGITYEFTNQGKFAEEHSLSRRQINACLNGASKSHKGWTFKYKEEDNGV